MPPEKMITTDIIAGIHKNDNIPSNDKKEVDISIKETMLAILFASLLGILFDYLFSDNSIGISHLVFTTTLIGFFMYSASENIKHKRKEG